MRAPQIILLILYALDIVVVGYLHGKPKTGTHNVGVRLADAFITLGILAWGGFFNG